MREGAHDRKLVNIPKDAPIATYPVLCLTLGEALAFAFFASEDDAVRAEALSKLRKLAVVEQGMTHPIGDWYVASVVAIVRALAKSGQNDVARTYLRQLACWVLNCYSVRGGLASFEDDESAEFFQLFAADFPALHRPTRRESLMVTAIMDLCAYIGDRKLYEDVENDIRYHGVIPNYYRTLDSLGQFRIDGADVVYSANVRFQRALPDPHDFEYGEHLVDEPRAYAMSNRFGESAHLALSLLLRNRYFPTTWHVNEPTGASVPTG